MRPAVASALTAAAAAVTLTACANPAAPASRAAVDATPRAAAAGGPMTAMAMPGGALASSADGFTLALRTPVLPAGRPATLRFQITAAGKPVTRFEPDMTKLMHLYLIRSDLTGFQHVHPVMAPGGTWTVQLAAHTPGSYRIFTAFTAANPAGKPVPVVLSAPVTIPGTTTTATLPLPTATATTDGYTLTRTGTAVAGMEHTLTITITRNGRPVTSLQPYLDSYAHLTAFRQGNLAFAHLHPGQAATSDHGGPALTFRTMFTQPGNYRLFLQFQTDGTLHTAAFTLPVR
jgi:hypothetical protein